MRNPFLFFLLLLATLFLAACNPYPHRTPEEFGASFFKALQAQDRKAVDRFLPTLDDMLVALDRDLRNEKGNKKQKASARKVFQGAWPLLAQEFQEDTDRDWDALLTEAGDAGVELAEATFLRVEAETSERDGQKMGQIDVFLDHEGTAYRIRFHKVASFPRGWLLGKGGFEWMGSR